MKYATQTNHSLIALAAIGVWLAWIITQEPVAAGHRTGGGRRVPEPRADGAIEKTLLPPPLPEMSTDPPRQPAAPREFDGGIIGGVVGGVNGGVNGGVVGGVNGAKHKQQRSGSFADDMASTRGNTGSLKERYSEMFAPASADTYSPF